MEKLRAIFGAHHAFFINLLYKIQSILYVNIDLVVCESFTNLARIFHFHQAEFYYTLYVAERKAGQHTECQIIIKGETKMATMYVDNIPTNETVNLRTPL